MDAQVHICGMCSNSFSSEEDYMNHDCKKTGFQPNQIEHQDAATGGRASIIAAKALERGSKKPAKKKSK